MWSFLVYLVVISRACHRDPTAFGPDFGLIIQLIESQLRLTQMPKGALSIRVRGKEKGRESVFDTLEASLFDAEGREREGKARKDVQPPVTGWRKHARTSGQQQHDTDTLIYNQLNTDVHVY